MIISGVQKLTLLDYPGKTACTVFFAGCNFRCPFCHNASLVRGEDGDGVSEEDFFAFLKRRRGMLDGVAVTGGEPLLQRELPAFLAKIKEMGLSVKLDTNGSLHGRLREIVTAGLVDYVAMDVKSSAAGYERVAGCSVPMDEIEQSIDYLLSRPVEYEFRTTAAKGLVTPEDFTEIGKRIAGAEQYFIQKFVDSGGLLGTGAAAYTPAEMEELLSRVLPYVPGAKLRGV